ncbi:MAG: site-2 protease family protein, partial [Acidimicrobiales bacterium]|nr:site-2 protease family protein [Acidimicrobiales bacterium]
MTAPAQNRGERRVVLIVLAAIGAYVLSQGLVTREGLYFLAAVIPSIILHEVSHGAVANAFGDDTAKRAGRLTLNPISHIDLFGTLLLPTLLVLANLTPIAFAKPVPVNVSRLRSPRNHSFLVSAAGPATNIVLALIAALAFRVMRPDSDTGAYELIAGFGLVNTLLATFNLLPIPPLDGSAFLERVLPRSMWPGYLKLRRWAMPALIIIVLWFPGGMSRLYDPVLDLWVRL